MILYLGDGESALNPLDEAGRLKLAADLRAQNIAFYAVPLGSPMNPHNLHALVGGTGGAVLRVADEKTEDPIGRHQGAGRPVPQGPGRPGPGADRVTLSAEAAEVYPAKLPPLRSDTPTLVVGRFEKGKAPASLELTIDGKVVGVRGDGQGVAADAGRRRRTTTSSGRWSPSGGPAGGPTPRRCCGPTAPWPWPTRAPGWAARSSSSRANWALSGTAGGHGQGPVRRRPQARPGRAAGEGRSEDRGQARKGRGIVRRPEEGGRRTSSPRTRKTCRPRRRSRTRCRAARRWARPRPRGPATRTPCSARPRPSSGSASSR